MRKHLFISNFNMKRFITDILLFFILVFEIAVTGDLIVSSGIRKTTIRPYAVWNDIYNGNNLDNELVFIGASSCWAHYNPHIIDSILGISSYNLGIDGHSWYPCQPLRYNTYVKYTHAPKYVIVNIDMGTFGVMAQPYEREQFFPYFWLDDSLISQIRDTKEITFMDRYCPMWRYIGYRKWIETGVASTFGKKCFEDDGVYKGHRGNTSPWDRASLNTMDSVTIEFNEFVADSMLHFIANRKAQGQTVLLVKTPIYYELQERFTNRAEMCARYDSIAKVADVRLLDYWEHPIVQDSTYFCNSTHLNKLGADLISTQLAHNLDSLGIIPTKYRNHNN